MSKPKEIEEAERLFAAARGEFEVAMSAALAKLSGDFLEQIHRYVVLRYDENLPAEESFTCPECGSHNFGTCRGNSDDSAFWWVDCHGDGCRWTGHYRDHVKNP